MSFLSNKKVLIAYGTRYGSTKEVAEEMKKIFNDTGLIADLVNLKEVPESDWPSLQDYNGVLIGSSIKFGKWMKEPISFLTKNIDFFKKELPFGIYVCSALAADPEKYSELKQEYIEQKIIDLSINVSLYDAFGGVIDLSSTTKFSWVDKRIVGMMAKNDPNLKKNERTDLRNWDQIRAFGEKFARLV